MLFKKIIPNENDFFCFSNIFNVWLFLNEVLPDMGETPLILLVPVRRLELRTY